MEPTATHLPVLAMLFQKYKIKEVLEFGCGLYSTPAFVKNGCNVTSIEMQNESWFESVGRELPQVDLRLALGPMEWEKEPLNDRYDLIFVDGHGDSRPECMMWAKAHSDLIVAHDTEHSYYGWERADMSGYKRTDFKDYPVYTSVWEKE